MIPQLRLGFTALAAAVTLACSLAVAGSAQAATVSFDASGSGGDGALAGGATFTTSAGELTVALTNTLAVDLIHSQGQGLSDISFTLSNTPGTLGATSASGQQGDVASSTGDVTYVSGSPVRFLGEGPPPPNGSGTFSITGDTISMEAIGGGQPSEMILPLVADGGAYTDGVTGGFDNFNPYTIGTATFTLDLSGVTSATTISDVVFSFGTGPDTFLDGSPTTPSPVPEPASLALLGTALVGFGLIRRRRKSV